MLTSLLLAALTTSIIPQDICEYHEKKTSLAAGSFKQVYTPECKEYFFQNKQEVTNCSKSVLKVSSSKEHNKLIKRELDVYEKLKSIIINMPEIYKSGTCNNGQKMWYLEEKFDMDLFDFLSNHGKECSVQNVFEQLLSTVAVQCQTLEQQGYGHFDVKPENIVVNIDKNYTITRMTLIDFGFLKGYNSDVIEGSPLFMNAHYFYNESEINGPLIMDDRMDKFAFIKTIREVLEYLCKNKFEKHSLIYEYLHEEQYKPYTYSNYRNVNRKLHIKQPDLVTQILDDTENIPPQWRKYVRFLAKYLYGDVSKKPSWDDIIATGKEMLLQQQQQVV